MKVSDCTGGWQGGKRSPPKLIGMITSTDPRHLTKKEGQDQMCLTALEHLGTQCLPAQLLLWAQDTEELKPWLEERDSARLEALLIAHLGERRMVATRMAGALSRCNSVSFLVGTEHMDQSMCKT